MLNSRYHATHTANKSKNTSKSKKNPPSQLFKISTPIKNKLLPRQQQLVDSMNKPKKIPIASTRKQKKINFDIIPVSDHDSHEKKIKSSHCTTTVTLPHKRDPVPFWARVDRFGSDINKLWSCCAKDVSLENICMNDHNDNEQDDNTTTIKQKYPTELRKLMLLRDAVAHPPYTL